MVSRPNCVEVKLGFDNIVLGHLQLLNIQVTTNYPLFVSGSQVVSGSPYDGETNRNKNSNRDQIFVQLFCSF